VKIVQFLVSYIAIVALLLATINLFHTALERREGGGAYAIAGAIIVGSAMLALAIAHPTNKS
jgi:hypothetical protein